MSQTPDPPNIDLQMPLLFLSRLCVSMSQGQPFEKALEPLFAPGGVTFHQCLPQHPLPRSHAEEVEAPADTIFLDECVREYFGAETPTDDVSSVRR